MNKTHTLAQQTENQTLVLKDIRAGISKLQTLQDDLPPYHGIPNWRVAQVRERLVEPTVCLTTQFFIATANLPIQTEQLFPAASKCLCHGKTMLAFRSGDGFKQICTIQAWWQLYHQAIRYGKWRAIPQSPAELYKSACGKSK